MDGSEDPRSPEEGGEVQNAAEPAAQETPVEQDPAVRDAVEDIFQVATSERQAEEQERGMVGETDEEFDRRLFEPLLPKVGVPFDALATANIQEVSDSVDSIGGFFDILQARTQITIGLLQKNGIAREQWERKKERGGEEAAEAREVLRELDRSDAKLRIETFDLLKEYDAQLRYFHALYRRIRILTAPKTGTPLDHPVVDGMAAAGTAVVGGVLTWSAAAPLAHTLEHLLHTGYGAVDLLTWSVLIFAEAMAALYVAVKSPGVVYAPIKLTAAMVGGKAAKEEEDLHVAYTLDRLNDCKKKLRECSRKFIELLTQLSVQTIRSTDDVLNFLCPSPEHESDAPDPVAMAQHQRDRETVQWHLGGESFGKINQLIADINTMLISLREIKVEERSSDKILDHAGEAFNELLQNLQAWFKSGTKQNGAHLSEALGGMGEGSADFLHHAHEAGEHAAKVLVDMLLVWPATIPEQIAQLFERLVMRSKKRKSPSLHMRGKDAQVGGDQQKKSLIDAMADVLLDAPNWKEKRYARAFMKMLVTWAAAGLKLPPYLEAINKQSGNNGANPREVGREVQGLIGGTLSTIGRSLHEAGTSFLLTAAAAASRLSFLPEFITGAYGGMLDAKVQQCNAHLHELEGQFPALLVPLREESDYTVIVKALYLLAKFQQKQLDADGIEDLKVLIRYWELRHQREDARHALYEHVHHAEVEELCPDALRWEKVEEIDTSRRTWKGWISEIVQMKGQTVNDRALLQYLNNESKLARLREAQQMHGAMTLLVPSRDGRYLIADVRDPQQPSYIACTREVIRQLIQMENASFRTMRFDDEGRLMLAELVLGDIVLNPKQQHALIEAAQLEGAARRERLKSGGFSNGEGGQIDILLKILS